MPSLRRLLCLLPLLCAGFELLGHTIIRAHVPEAVDYVRAGAELRNRFQAGDVIAAAPPFIDPLLREQVGDLIPLSMAGRHDLSAYRRLWSLSIRGHQPPVVARLQPAWHASYGEVTLARYALPEPTAVLDLVETLPKARVERVTAGGPRSCPYREGVPDAGGRLGAGTVAPSARFHCGAGRDGMVAAVVIEDLELAPRYCVWHPALNGRTLRVRFPDVRLADELVIYAGLYYEHERHGEHPPVTLRVRLDGEELAHWVHRDGAGFQRWTVPTRSGQSGSLEFETDSARRKHPGFCWHASLHRRLP